ncbi:hypothetical protein [Oryzobacter telluris]|uniref:hypothetical protein n=1 Tax=Oryzobacter telluris TaxID=3149179 RepID=UPI00370D0B4E
MSDARDPDALLVDRLHALAVSTGTLDLPPAEVVREGGERRRRRARTAAAGSVLAAVVLGAGVAVTSGLSRDRADAPLPATSAPAPTASADPSPSTSPTAAPEPTASGTVPPPADPGRVALGSIGSVALPAGWRVEHPRGERENTLCLADPATDRPSWAPCTLQLAWGDGVVGRDGGPWSSHQRDGWRTTRTAPAGCPLWGPEWVDDGGPVVGLEGGLPARSLGAVGPKVAELSWYVAGCRGGGGYLRPRIWWLPVTGLQATDLLNHPRSHEVLASVRFATDSGSTGLHFVHGEVIEGHGTRTLRVAPTRTLTNDVEGFRWQRERGRGEEFMGNPPEVSTGAPVTVRITDRTSCFSYDGTTTFGMRQIACEDLGSFGVEYVDAVVTPSGEARRVVEPFRS